MKFVSAIWKLLVGIKDALVLLLLLLFFGALYAVLRSSPEPAGSGVLAMKLSRPVMEQPAGARLSELAGGSATREYRLRDMIAALDAARTDGSVKAVALELDGFSAGGQTGAADLAEAVARVRKSGKPVVAYATGYSDAGYLVAAAASEIWLNPLGAVVVTGPGGSNLYYKGLLDKLGVTANIYRVGTYKSAVEPYTRSDMSPEARANYQALTGALLETWRERVQQLRPNANVDLFLGNMNGAVQAAGGDIAQAALRAGLVDKVADRRAYEQRLEQLGGKSDRGDGFASIKLESYIRDKVKPNSSGTIGVVTIAGMIVDGKSPQGTAGGDSIAESIEAALRNDDLKALVVRVDSPGGSVTASERIRQALLAAKEKKMPIVVSMGNVAASGGYWVSTPADFIYAEPSTITGSIGVFGVLPSFQGTLQKLGVGADGVKSTPLSGEPDLLRGPSPEVSQLIQTGVESTYRRFLGIVGQSRRKSPAEIDRIAQGRVWDGGSARQIGLVDGFGGMEEAIAKAGELAKLDEDNRGVRDLERPRSLTESLIATLAGAEDEDASQDAFAGLRGDAETIVARALTDARMILSGPTIQVRCLECPGLPARNDAPRSGLLERIAAWLS
ncbi:signal peptide peptidase SppA [Sphingomonas piscis]|uniref:Signal peptide peptidase SppA n=1 Tax=Sphingomonas piscis TaxID=2714943 RepID=A0A6G7YRA0_9SPHN|nr:signal peptide peptidase SppA [Sphingomonas piscis]QIK79261.1 signal peptide peptidase SppA [Sphingomonas piscis]